MTKRRRDLVLGIATAFPLISSWSGALIEVPWFKEAAREHRDVGVFSALMLASIITEVLLVFALIAFYLRDVARNPRVPQELKARWGAAIVLFHALALPVYWYLFVWRRSQRVESGSADLSTPNP